MPISYQLKNKDAQDVANYYNGCIWPTLIHAIVATLLYPWQLYMKIQTLEF